MYRPGRSAPATLLLLAVTMALLVALLASASPASAGSIATDGGTPALPQYETVVIVLVPYLTWDDITSGSAPSIASLARDGAIASASIRLGSTDVSPTSARGAAILSAGRTVKAPAPGSTGPVRPVGGLGASVLAADGFTAAIGTSVAAGASGDLAHLPALLVAGDGDGHVSLLSDTESLLVADASAPYGVRADREAVEAAYVEALARRRGPTLIVIDPGDLERARQAGERLSADGTGSAQDDVASSRESMRKEAVRATDAMVSQVARLLPEEASLLVVSTAQYPVDDASGLAPVVLWGAGEGLLASSGTRTDGLVTLPDLTATIAALLGVESPPGIVGSVASIVDKDVSADARIARVVSADATARSLEALRMPSWAVLVAGWVTLVCAGAAVVFRERGRGVRTCGSRFLAGALVVLFALPCGMMLVQAFVAPVTAAGARGQLLAWCTAAVFVAVLLVRGRGVPEALGIIAGLTALVILGDQLLGAPLARGNPLSYSVIYATRFYGLGNEGAGILVAVTLIGIGSRLDSGRGTPRDFLLAGVPVLLVAVLPFLGANVGPAAWGTVAFVAAYLYATGRKITWRLVCAAVAAVAALVGLAALLDLASPEVSHLGRLVESLGAGRGGLAAVLASKVGMVVTIIRATPLVFVLPVGMALLIYLVARPGGPLGRVILARRGFGSALVGSLGGALVSLVTEDSGIALAGFILFFAVMALAALALDAMPQAVPDRRLEAS